MTIHCELRGVHKRYRGHVVLSDFDLQIDAGEMVAITGASGSGKSTVLNMIGLLDDPDSGEIRIFGETAPKSHSRAANRYRRHRLGYLFQNFALMDNASVKQNLDIALTYSRDRTPKKHRVAEALAHVGLPEAKHRKVYSLSGGEQQRVAVARLLLKSAEVVLADEPTGSLDPENRDVVLALLREMNNAGKTVIIASHDPEVVRACSRAVTLRMVERTQTSSTSDH